MECRWDWGRRARRRKDSRILSETTVGRAFIIKRHWRAFSEIMNRDKNVEVAEGLPPCSLTAEGVLDTMGLLVPVRPP